MARTCVEVFVPMSLVYPGERLVSPAAPQDS